MLQAAAGFNADTHIMSKKLRKLLPEKLLLEKAAIKMLKKMMRRYCLSVKRMLKS